MRDVRFHPRVPSEAREIAAHYDEVSPDLGDRFWLELTEAIEYARKYPERHHFEASGRRRFNLKRFPHNFLFRVFDDHIRITAVRHNRRNPNLGARRK